MSGNNFVSEVACYKSGLSKFIPEQSPNKLRQYWGIPNTGAKEETQRDISKFKNQMTRDKGKEAGLRKHINSI